MNQTQEIPVANISFPDEEEKILKYWREIDAFQTSLKHSSGKPRYTFYDGPPFPTGLPHYGHILGGTVKDVVTRWAHQTGYHVERRFGWDCHGLPVEYEIDKTLGIKCPKDVRKMGIKAYNDECRKIVMRYSTEWQEIVTRLGRWIDFDNDYKTMYPSFIESIWWVTKELHRRGLLYKDTKIVPYSTACNTPLSNFEAVQNCKLVEDPSVIVTFPLLDEPNVALIAWTASPWTLPSNLSLCVNPNMNYVKIKDNATEKVFIMMEARLETLFKKNDEYTVLKKYEGLALEGLRYNPIFPYFKYMREKTGAFQVLLDEQVSSKSGTGVVPLSPYFGEDDYRVCLKYGVITQGMDIISPVDETGKFTDEIEDFKGLYVKDADKCIIKYLREKGRLVHQATFKHKYPFCWRSETPLIFKAVPSWFVRVEQAASHLLENNQKTYWVPNFVKERKFADWLREPQDWVVSRNRYWGTPIPIWISEDGKEIVCVGSLEELKQLSGVEVTDLHREFLDNVTIPSKLGKGLLRRTPEVFDCWFDIGCVPYAHIHYPFERKNDFDDSFPADIIAEGLDQTRGWFYTLLVLSTLLFEKPAFKNVIVNGIVLAEDGNKMSKRLKNYPDPMLIVHKYGADALRFYLCNSPALKAEGLRFKEKDVEGVVKNVFLPWYHAYRFFMQNVDNYQTENCLNFLCNEHKIRKRANYMDRWILSLAQSLIKFVRSEMQAYRLYTLMPRLVQFIKQLTNWYIRMNRRRIKGENGPSDCRMALETLFTVLMTMIRLLAPMVPYITEYMFQGLRNFIDPESVGTHDTRSVHFLMIPSYREDLIDNEAEKAVLHMQSVIKLGRIIRAKNKLPLTHPLKELIVIQSKPENLKDIQSLKSYIMKELNVQTVRINEKKSDCGAHLAAKTNFKSLAEKMKKAVKSIDKSVQELSNAELEMFQSTGRITLADHVLRTGDIKLMLKCDRAKVKSSYDASWNKEVLVLIDISPDQNMLNEGLAREVIKGVQKLRKKGGLNPSDQISVYYKASETLQRILQEFRHFISNAIRHQILPFPVPVSQKVVLQKAVKVKREKLEIAIVKLRANSGPSKNVSILAPARANHTSFCKFVNGVIVGVPQ